ncbi:MAG: hypothetical protein ACFN0U_04785 [Porphyromonas asaccharolytica]
MMPKMSGYDLIDEIQILAPDQPFLFITAKTSAYNSSTYFVMA